MLLEIVHTTTYRYRRNVAFGVHRMALSPRAGQELRVHDADLACEPSAALRETEDVFGNKVTLAIFDVASDRLIVTNRLKVELTAPEWPVFRIAIDAMTYPFKYTADEIVDLGALRDPVELDGIVADWARGFIFENKVDTLSLLKAINAALQQSIRYEARDEAGTRTPKETLAQRVGSCRDIAALFIEAARLLGFGARAVSGYLYDPHALPQDDGSTHAWAEIYLPEAGWISFDPTHARLGSANLIPTAVGRRNDQIMPVLGSFIGAADDFVGLDVAVRISRLS